MEFLWVLNEISAFFITLNNFTVKLKRNFGRKLNANSHSFCCRHLTPLKYLFVSLPWELTLTTRTLKWEFAGNQNSVSDRNHEVALEYVYSFHKWCLLFWQVKNSCGFQRHTSKSTNTCRVEGKRNFLKIKSVQM